MKVKISNTEYLSVSKHTGKMSCIPSLSTDKYLNKNCLKLINLNNDNVICKHCYVDKSFKMYSDLEPSLVHNTNILAKRLLTPSEIKMLSEHFLNTMVVRFESWGDLNNEIQLINYLNLAKACKRTYFALFTKHYSIVLNYLKKGLKMPKNVTLVLSSPYLDKELNELLVNTFKKYHSRVITFTVTKDKSNPNINCGKRRCIDCRNCYDSKKPQNVIELIK